jgi:sucrose-6-phosphatase
MRVLIPPKLLLCMSELITAATKLALFVTDLDNTLVGDAFALKILNDWLDRSRQEHGTKIVYATGRSLNSYRTLATSAQLLPPDALVSAVGTEVYLDCENIWSDWQQHIAPGWQRAKISEIATHFADLKPQPLCDQGDFKASYYLSEAAAIEIIPRLRQELKQNNIVAEIVYSGQKDLDIIPKNSNKGSAVQFLRDYWSIDAPATVVCGDSGNDISLFSYDLEYGVLVGNAQQELRLWYEMNATERHYLASANCSGGIIEGLRYFGFVDSEVPGH